MPRHYILQQLKQFNMVHHVNKEGKLGYKILVDPRGVKGLYSKVGKIIESAIENVEDMPEWVLDFDKGE